MKCRFHGTVYIHIYSERTAKMAETYISIEKIRSLAEVGTIDELKAGTDINEIFAACAIASKEYLSLIPYDEQLTAAAELTKGRRGQDAVCRICRKLYGEKRSQCQNTHLQRLSRKA